MENEKNDRAMHRKARKRFAISVLTVWKLSIIRMLRVFASLSPNVQRFFPPRYRHLCRSSARADHRYQACASR